MTIPSKDLLKASRTICICIISMLCSITPGKSQTDTLLQCQITDIVAVSCFGLADGQATVEIESTFPSTFIWSNGDTTLSVSNLLAGEYEVNLLDSLNNMGQCSVTIPQPDSLSVEIELSNIINCAATANVTGGQPLYNYEWSNGDDQMTVNSVNAILRVVVTDANGCQSNATIDSTVLNAICGTCNDGMLNGDETEIDCGGIVCPPCDTTTVTPLQLTKQGAFNDLNANGNMDVGETITYTFSVCNNGDEAINSVSISDTMVDVSGDMLDLGPNECDEDNFTAVYEITAEDLQLTLISNSAVAQGLTRDGNILTDISDDPDNLIDIDTEGDGEPDDPTDIAVIANPEEFELTIIDFIKNLYVGSEICLDVLVVSKESKLPTRNVDVNFAIVGQNDFSESATTNGSGLARQCYTANSVGLDTIMITVQGDTLELVTEVLNSDNLNDSIVIINNQISDGLSLNSGGEICDTVDIVYNESEVIFNLPVILSISGTTNRTDTLFTNEDGVVEYCVNNSSTGIDTIMLSVGSIGEQFELNWIGASGCTDVLACNYDSTAIMNNGSCIYRDCDGLCPDDIDSVGDTGDSIMLNGTVYTDINRILPNVEVKVIAVGQDQTVFTDSLGEYEISGIEPGANYRVSADRVNNSVDGVSTLDMLFIQRHILRLDSLTSPYKIIAADVTNNASVSIADIIYIRRLILGVVETWGPDFNWHFIDADTRFLDPYRPWPFNGDINLIDVSSSECELDFIGVKLGDVNNSLESDFNLKKEKRSNKSLRLEYKRIELNNGNHRLDFYGDVNDILFGFQLNLNNIADSYVDISSEELKIGSADYVINNDALNISWTNPYGQYVDRLQPLFSIEITGDFDGVIDLNEEQLKDEFYIDSDFSIYDINLVEQTEDEVIILAASPNPFKETCQISIDAKKSTDLLLNVFDASGKEVFSRKYQVQGGENQISISKDHLPKSGIYQYVLSHGVKSHAGRLVFID